MEEHPNQNMRKRKITCKNFMPRQASSVLEVYTATTLSIAKLQVRCLKNPLRGLSNVMPRQPSSALEVHILQ